jgi:hypothetical protein
MRTVNKIEEDAIVEVSDAPIPLNPNTYSKAAKRGNNENNNKITQSHIDRLTAEDSHKITTNIKPEVRREAPVTSIVEYFETSFVIKIIPDANVTADRIASKSPKVRDDIINNNDEDKGSIVPLATVTKKPANAIITPISCTVLNLSLRKSQARNNTATVSRGPASRPSFEAPTLLTESYHVNIPPARKIEAGIRYFHDLKIVIFFLMAQVIISSNTSPANEMLIAAIAREEISSNPVSSSTIIDSIDSVTAWRKTTQDFRIKIINY